MVPILYLAFIWGGEIRLRYQEIPRMIARVWFARDAMLLY